MRIAMTRPLFLIMSHLVSLFPQTEISTLAVVNPGASHGFTFTFGDIVNSLTIVSLRVELHRDSAGVGLEGRTRDRKIANARVDSAAQVGVFPPQVEPNRITAVRIGP